MSSNNNGGYAFPFATPNTGITHMECGMSLRDYIAVHALSQAVEDYGTPGRRGRDDHGERITPYSARGVGTREEIIAWQAYRYADAMLKAREASNA
ncbi:MAG: hypothetical protein VYB05_07650 [Pseudomonadota bacterium]|nr:hypothetical protein [Pseudomonadota bacterium]